MIGRRVPVLLGQAAAQCGAACLAMIASAHGRATTVAEASALADVGRDGSTAAALVRVAAKLGMALRPYAVDEFTAERGDLPVVVHWGFNHWLVVERTTRRWVDVVDPAVGRRRIGWEEFGRRFTGVVLVPATTPDFRPLARSPQPWRAYVRALWHVRGVRPVAGGMVVSALLLQALALLGPAVTAVVVDQIVPHHASSLLLAVGVALALFAATRMATDYLRGLLLISLRCRLDHASMTGFFGHVLALPYRVLQRRSSGDLLMRLTSNVAIRETLGNQTLTALLDSMTAVALAVVLLVVSPSFGAVALSLAAVQAIALAVVARPMRRRVSQELITQAESQSCLMESLTGITTIKAAGAETRAMRQWENLFLPSLQTTMDRQRLSAGLSAITGTVTMFAPLTMLWFAVHRVLAGSLSLGAALALVSLGTAFVLPMSSVFTSAQQLQLVGGQLDRLLDVLTEPTEQDTPMPACPELTGQVEFRDVSHRYDRNSPWAVRGVSFRVPVGTRVAVVGRTGSGKSTLVRLMLGLLRPEEGAVLFDGIDGAQVDVASLRHQFGVVLQEPFLFNGSVRDNIAYNDPDMPLDSVHRAARRAAVHDDVMAWPMGYETLVGEGGAALSGGQRQRLAIARALAHRPALLVLDEATSSLDTATEATVRDAVRDLKCTVVTVAHRLSTVRDANVILVLDDGQIVERGTHAELMATGGHYRALFDGQPDPIVVTPAGQQV